MSTTQARSGALEAVLGRYRPLLRDALRATLDAAHAMTPRSPATEELLRGFYAQIDYHQGWRAPDLTAAPYRPGKLLRPTLLLLAAEIAATHHAAAPCADEINETVRHAVPAALAVELVHNFSLVHDDIEDGDEERHHQPTLWKLFGMPQAINTGDGIFALARMQLWQLPARGVTTETCVRLATLLDRTCLELVEGQHLDMAFEGRHDVTGEMYLDMIGRKTAALMACAAAMGAILGAPEDTALSDQLAAFGRALGLGFQLRDDLLGIWSAAALGKSEAGDLRRKKVSLPVIYALKHAPAKDRRAIATIYGEPGPASEEQIAVLLDALDRAGARDHVRGILRDQCAAARAALDAACASAPDNSDACDALGTLLAFVEAEGV